MCESTQPLVSKRTSRAVANGCSMCSALGGRDEMTLRFGDYRVIAGVLFPDWSELRTELTGMIVTQIESIDVNADVRKVAFDASLRR